MGWNSASPAIIGEAVAAEDTGKAMENTFFRRDSATGDWTDDVQKTSTVASASTVTTTTPYTIITGTSAIYALAPRGVGQRITLKFSGVLTLMHIATSLILPGGANITTYAGMVLEFFEETAGVWRCVGGLSLPAMGVTAGSNAAAGVVGEVYTGAQAPSLAMNTSNAVYNVASIALPAGDWSISASIEIDFTAGFTTGCQLAVSKTSATFPTSACYNQPVAGEVRTNNTYPSSVGPSIQLAITPYAFSTTGQTLYLVAIQTGATGASAYGHIQARRIR